MQQKSTTSNLRESDMEFLMGALEVAEIAAAIVGTLAVAIVVLWRRHEANTKDLRQALNKCDEKHDQAIDNVVKLSSEVGELRGRIGGVEYLSDRVISEVRTLKSGRG